MCQLIKIFRICGSVEMPLRGLIEFVPEAKKASGLPVGSSIEAMDRVT